MRRPSSTILTFGSAYVTAVALYLVGTITVFNTPVYAGSDAGVFNAIFYQMSLGRTLYRDVFDIKDPLFFHGHAWFRDLLGISGPMFWETLLTALTVAVLFRIAWRVGLSAGPSLLAVLAYLVFYFNPDVYQPLHTYHQGLFFLFAAIALAFEDRPLPAGMAVALAGLSKATLVTFAPAVLVAVALPLVRRHNTGTVPRFLRFAIGGLLAGSLVTLFLAVTGELPGYLDVFRANFGYTELISDALGWHNDPVGRAREVVGDPMLVVLGLAAAVVAGRAAVVLRGRRGDVTDQEADSVPLAVFGVTLACFAGWALILRQAAWFNHYFASLAPAAFFVAVALPVILRSLFRKPAGRLLHWAGAGTLVVASLVTGFYPASALEYRAPSCPFSLPNKVQNPEFVDCLRTVEFSSGPRRTFAVIGPNSNDTPVASTPPDFVLGCRLFFQFPWNGPRMLDELIDCMDRDVDVVIAENLLHFNRPEDQARARRIDSTIRGKFDLVGQCGRFTIWERKTLRVA